MYLTMEALEDELHVDMYAQCESYFNARRLPKNRSENLGKMFAAKRKTANKEAGTFKATASEGLSLCSLFAMMLLLVVGPLQVCVQQLQAYMLMANVVDLLHNMPVKPCAPSKLKDAVSAFLTACKACGWQTHCHPKFHWILHMPKHLARWGMLPNTWVHERKHKVAKRYGSWQHNTTQYEKSILLERLGHCLAELKEENIFSMACRLEKSPPSQRMKAFLQDYMVEPAHSMATSSTAFLSPGGSCQKADVVVFKHALLVGQVYFHAEYNGQVISLISMWDLLENEPQKGCCLCSKNQGRIQMVDTADIACAVPYCQLSEDRFRVFIPLPYRQGNP